MPNCDRCGNRVSHCKRGVFGYNRLGIACYCYLLYGPTNNVDPTVKNAKPNKRLNDYE